ncbi:MAG: metalloregulator ArsR/SmtB family transcription factor [Planctomycetota bacterium]
MDRSLLQADADRLVGIRRIGRAFADTTRVRILASLRDGERCAAHFAALLAVDPATVTRHVKVLREAGLVVTRRRARRAYLSRAQPDSPLWLAMDGLAEGAPELEEDCIFLDASERADARHEDVPPIAT